MGTTSQEGSADDRAGLRPGQPGNRPPRRRPTAATIAPGGMDMASTVTVDRPAALGTLPTPAGVAAPAREPVRRTSGHRDSPGYLDCRCGRDDCHAAFAA